MQNKDIIMISLDTSTANSGVAIWKNGVLDNCFSFKKPAKEAPGNSWMTTQLFDLFNRINPDIIILEAVNVMNNMKTMTELVTLIGRIQGFCIAKDIFYDDMGPNKWRKLISPDEVIPRKRAETKPWAIKKVKELFHITEEDDNICEAILIGQAYINLTEREKTV